MEPLSKCNLSWSTNKRNKPNLSRVWYKRSKVILTLWVSVDFIPSLCHFKDFSDDFND